MKKYMMIKPEHVQTSWQKTDNRYRMKAGVCYEVKRVVDDYYYLHNPESLHRDASFYGEHLLGPFTREENPEMFL